MCNFPSSVHTLFSHVARAAALLTSAVSAQHTWDPNIAFVVFLACYLEKMLSIHPFDIDIWIDGDKFIRSNSIFNFTTDSKFNTWYAMC